MTLKNLNSGSNDKFTKYIENYAAITIQKNFRGAFDRKGYNLQKEKLEVLKNLFVPMY